MGKKSHLMRGEGGQVLILTVIVMMLAALIIPPILGLTYSNAQTTNIRKERMQVLYAADTGIQVALHKLDNLGNSTDPNIPDAIGEEIVWPPLTVEQSGLPVDVQVKIYKDGNGTYLITSTASNWNNRKITVQAHVHLATVEKGVGPRYEPGEGNVSTSPFDYAFASLGTEGPKFGTHPPTILGDVYSNGPILFPAGSTVESDVYHPGNVWAKGTVTLLIGVSISGSVHSEGDIILYDGASIGGSAYANGSIYLAGTAKIYGGAGAYGSINVTTDIGKKVGFGSLVGNSSVAYGDIHVSGPVSGWGFNVGGEVASNQNIIVDNNGRVVGDASAGGTVTHTNGIINGTVTEGAPEFVLTLDEVPTLVPGNISEWMALYKTEAQSGGNISGDYIPAKNAGDVYLGNTYIAGRLELKEGTVLHLDGTVYVEQTVDIKSGANVMGLGKLVSVGDMWLYNNLIGDPDAMPLLMTYPGCFQLKNQNAANPGTLYAVLYAPNCSVDIQNWNTVTGCVVAKSIITGQGFQAEWTPEVAEIDGLPGGNVTGTEGSWIPVEQPPTIVYQGVVIDYYIVCENEECT